MKTALVLFVLLALNSIALGSPFLVCDPAEHVDSYIVEIDGVAFPTESPLHYDLSGLSVGEHFIKVKAVNDLWGPSDYSDPISPVKPLVGVPSGVGLSAE